VEQTAAELPGFHGQLFTYETIYQQWHENDKVLSSAIQFKLLNEQIAYRCKKFAIYEFVSIDSVKFSCI